VEASHGGADPRSVSPETLTAAHHALDGAESADDAVASLIRRGIDRDTAERAVAAAGEEREAEVQRLEGRRRPFATAFVAGVACALAAGAAWGWIFVASGDRLGPLAWLIGIAVGAVVVRVGRSRGRRAQVLALACAAVGFLLGKYLTYALPLNDLTNGRIGVLSLEAERSFASATGAWGPGDALFAGLALWGAWAAARIPRPKRRSIV
jgi:hypothetical protein